MPGHCPPVGQGSPSGSCTRLRVVFSLRFPSASLSGASELILRGSRGVGMRLGICEAGGSFEERALREDENEPGRDAGAAAGRGELGKEPRVGKGDV